MEHVLLAQRGKANCTFVIVSVSYTHMFEPWNYAHQLWWCKQELAVQEVASSKSFGPFESAQLAIHSSSSLQPFEEDNSMVLPNTARGTQRGKITKVKICWSTKVDKGYGSKIGWAEKKLWFSVPTLIVSGSINLGPLAVSDKGEYDFGFSWSFFFGILGHLT